jgi:hypothetical protein
MKALTTALLSLLLLGLCGAALYPVMDRALARSEVRRLVEEARAAASGGAVAPAAREQDLDLGVLTGLRREPSLHCWGNIGGCGAGGGSASGAGGAKWVGRSITGGLVDVQVLATQAVSHGNYFTTFNTRLGTGVLTKWNFGVNVPILYKAGDVDVLGQTRPAGIAGFGDISVEITRKLGITNASMLTLIVSAPAGAHDAQRVGVVLPQHLQLGSGVVPITLQLEHTVDRDWGLMIFGGNAAYNGWENSIKDWRSPSFTGYAYVGYIWHAFVPSAGLTLFGKPLHDRERGDDRPDDQDPLFMAVPSLALEWSVSDYIALLLYVNSSFSYNGFESVSGTLGITTSVF